MTNPQRAAAGNRRFALAAITVSLATWEVSFSLGAWGTIFFEKFLLIWAASIGLLLALVFSRREYRTLRRRDVLILTLPSVWFGLQALQTIIFSNTQLPDNIGVSVEVLIALVETVAFIICLPYVLNLLADMLYPEMARLSRKQQQQIVGIFIVIALVGFLVGYRNDLFLTCEDFSISGNSLPTNCRPASQ